MAKKQSIKFHYIRTPGYRNYHVDGIFGGITPKGLLHMDLFVERNPISSMVEQEITESGTPGKVIEKKIETDGIIRQIECGLIIDLNTAGSIRDWIDAKIKEFQKIVKESNHVE